MKKNLFLILILNFLVSFYAHTVHSNLVRLVNDQEEINKYIASFPAHLYQIYEVPEEGKFFIEPSIPDPVKNVLRKGYTWEPHLVPLIKQYIIPGTNAIDIGAHIGTLTMVMARCVGDHGHVYAFEPQKKIFRELIANCVLNNVHKRVAPCRYAIGDRNELIEMNETKENNEAGTEIGLGGDIVEMRTLDSFNFKNISLIKIDVERTEDAVLNGMIKTIQENKPVIIIEIQGGYPWEKASNEIRMKILNTKKKLNDLGYSVTRIEAHDYLAIPIF